MNLAEQVENSYNTKRLRVLEDLPPYRPVARRLTDSCYTAGLLHDIGRPALHDIGRLALMRAFPCE